MTILRTVRNRIASVEKIKKITNALEIVALTRLRHMEEGTLASRSYFDAIRQMLFDLAANINFKSHPFLKRHQPAKTVGIVCIFSDKGLCGNFNANIGSKFLEFASGYKDKKIKVAIMGKKGARYLKRRSGYQMLTTFALNDSALEKNIVELAQVLIEEFLHEDLDEIFLLYSKFRRHLLGEVKIIKLLPFVLEDSHPQSHQQYQRDYIYEPGASEIFDRLVREYVVNQMHQGAWESRCAEEISRMLAMKFASDNADEMIARLNLTYHKTRQAQITRELSEVIAASEAAA